MQLPHDDCKLRRQGRRRISAQSNALGLEISWSAWEGAIRIEQLGSAPAGRYHYTNDVPTRCRRLIWLRALARKTADSRNPGLMAETSDSAKAHTTGRFFPNARPTEKLCAGTLE
jgi:hypothetical protein